MEEFFNELKRFIIMAIAGAIGGLVAALNTKQRSFCVLTIAALTGSLVAGFGVPIIMEYFDIKNEELRLGLAFFLGTMSTPIIQKLARNPGWLLRSKK